MAMAVVGHPTQPDSQPKSISVALQTATQNPKSMFLVQPRSPSYQARQNAFWPLGNLAPLRPSVAPLPVSTRIGLVLCLVS
jgi:hypothetical protein